MTYCRGTEPLQRRQRPTRLALRRPAARWSGSSSSPTARSARAAPGSSSPMPTSPTRAGCNSIPTPRCSQLADAGRGGGFQVATHAIGDAANAQVIAAYEQLSQKYRRRPPLADRAFPDRRSGRHPAPRAGRDHRLDAADPPDQRPADGRGAARAEPARRRLCLADGAEERRAARVRLRLPGRIAQPLPRPRRGDQPPGHERPAAGRLDSAASG